MKGREGKEEGILRERRRVRKVKNENKKNQWKR